MTYTVDMRAWFALLTSTFLAIAHAQTRIAPTALNVDKGLTQSGNLASLAADDADPLVTTYFFTPGDIYWNQRLFFTVSANTTVLAPTQFKLEVKASALSAGVISLALEVFNSRTNTYERSPEVPFLSQYSLYDFAPTGDLARFVRASDGAVKARFWTFGFRGPLSRPLMTGDVEYFHWIVAP